MVQNGENWLDTDAKPISAHGGGITRVGEIYYWYGCSYVKNPEGMFNERPYVPMQDPATLRRFFDGFNVYSSRDLVNWRFEGKAFFAEKGFCTLYGSHRPHVMYNERTKKFVMHFYYYMIYPGCLLMAATSDLPTGPFVLAGVIESGSFNGHVGDMNIFNDQEGRGYVIYDDTGFDLRLDRLTDDYCGSHKDGILVMEKPQEAPAVVYYKGKYLFAGSGVEGWDPTETTLVYADSPMGPYSPKQVISCNRTWRSQITDMVHIPEADYVLVMCDQWKYPYPDNIDRSRYLWLPLRFDPQTGQARLDYRATWDPMRPFDGET